MQPAPGLTEDDVRDLLGSDDDGRRFLAILDAAPNAATARCEIDHLHDQEVATAFRRVFGAPAPA